MTLSWLPRNSIGKKFTVLLRRKKTKLAQQKYYHHNVFRLKFRDVGINRCQHRITRSRLGYGSISYGYSSMYRCDAPSDPTGLFLCFSIIKYRKRKHKRDDYIFTVCIQRCIGWCTARRIKFRCQSATGVDKCQGFIHSTHRRHGFVCAWTT